MTYEIRTSAERKQLWADCLDAVRGMSDQELDSAEDEHNLKAEMYRTYVKFGLERPAHLQDFISTRTAWRRAFRIAREERS